MGALPTRYRRVTPAMFPHELKTIRKRYFSCEHHHHDVRVVVMISAIKPSGRSAAMANCFRCHLAIQYVCGGGPGIDGSSL
eukprot:2380899-Rhodomonas_salina.2